MRSLERWKPRPTTEAEKEAARRFQQATFPSIIAGTNEMRFQRLLRDIGRAPNLHIRVSLLETCLKQVWPLVPEADEDLFFDNVQAVERQTKKWRQ